VIGIAELRAPICRLVQLCTLVTAHFLLTKNASNFGLQPKPRRLLWAPFPHFSSPPVSYDSTRKSFLAKLAGLTAVIGLAPRWLAPGAAVAAAPAPEAAPRPAVTVNPDRRAVARRTDSV
jgi:hypothetical protein